MRYGKPAIGIGTVSALTTIALCGACDRQAAGQAPAATASTPVAAPTASIAASAPAPVASRPALPSGAEDCGDLGCMQFQTPEDAFRHVLNQKPAILAVGEAHAQKGKEGVPSATKRFTQTFLPFLQGKASDLVVELMAPNDTCRKKTKAVRKKHEVVTKRHAATNQSEYVKMGERARKLGIVPDLLRPSCEDLAAIQKAGDGAIPLTLETIARLTTKQVDELLQTGGRKADEADKLIVTYGGVLHNDPAPGKARAAWSFGPALKERAKGRYVALDLFVPEYIEDTELWRNQPWFGHYDKARLGPKTTLFRLDDESFVLIFPLSEPPLSEP